MASLNYHHLRYFHEVAREGNLTRASERLNLSQSALSTQIRTLEDRLGHALFDRVGRSLHLTEAGRIALDHADRIFSTGQELLATLQQAGADRPPLRVGALSTLSRNFQMSVLSRVLSVADVDLELRSGGNRALLDALQNLMLDVVLTTEPPGSAFGPEFRMHRLEAQSVGLYAKPSRLLHRTLKELLSVEPLILPSESNILSGIMSLADRLEVKPHIVAQVDDMAMIRVLARHDIGVAVVPSVVLADEIANGTLAAAPFDLGISESFYAVTVARAFPHPLLPLILGDGSD